MPDEYRSTDHGLSDPVHRARALAPAIAATAAEIEQTQRFPAPLLEQLHAARLYRMLLPGSAGGDEVEPWVYVAAVEELSRADGSVGWNVFVGNSSALIAPFLTLESARTVFGDARAVVSWGAVNDTRARAVPGGYRVTGSWRFSSGCRQATWMGAHCQVVEADGGLRRHRDGRVAIRTLLFPAAEARLEDDWDTIGLRGTASGSYSVEDIFVPEAFSSTREEPEPRRDPGRLYAFPMQGLYCVGVAAVAMGIARAMLEAFAALAADKVPRGLQRLADSAVVQSELARNEARLGAARAYLCETLRECWERVHGTEVIGLDARARVRLAGVHAIEAASAVADYAYKAAGTDAIVIGSAFERRFRDIHTVAQQIQARTAHYETVGKILLGHDVGVFF